MISMIYYRFIEEQHLHILMPSLLTLITKQELRACASCHANNRQEQLFSGFSTIASCDCTRTVTSEETIQSNDVIKETMTTGTSPSEGIISRNWLPLLFVGVSIIVVAIAILFGQLLVTRK